MAAPFPGPPAPATEEILFDALFCILWVRTVAAPSRSRTSATKEKSGDTGSLYRRTPRCCAQNPPEVERDRRSHFSLEGRWPRLRGRGPRLQKRKAAIRSTFITALHGAAHEVCAPEGVQFIFHISYFILLPTRSPSVSLRPWRLGGQKSSDAWTSVVNLSSHPLYLCGLGVLAVKNLPMLGPPW